MGVEESQFYWENNIGLIHQMPTLFNPVDNNLNFSAVVDPQQQQTPSFPAAGGACWSSSAAMAVVLNSELQLQKQGMDSLLHLQKEKLRKGIEEQMKRQVTAIISNVETEAYKMMKQKDADLAEATNRRMELQHSLNKAETKTQAWKTIASAKEATLMGLHAELEEARQKHFLLEAESHHYASQSPQQQMRRRRSRSAFGSCRACKNTNPNPSCVLFLPCRHLCYCKVCEALLGCCPVCHSVKEATLEVLLL